MAMDNTTEPAVRAARTALRNAMITFATSTAPSLAATLNNAIIAADPTYPMFSATDDGAFYAAAKIYVDRLIAQGAFGGPALPLR